MEHLFYLYVASAASAAFGYTLAAILSSGKRVDANFHVQSIIALQKDIKELEEKVNFYKTNLSMTEAAQRQIEHEAKQHLLTARKLCSRAGELPTDKLNEINKVFIEEVFHKEFLDVMLTASPEALELYDELLTEAAKCENCNGNGDIEFSANSKSIEPNYETCNECKGSGAIV